MPAATARPEPPTFVDLRVRAHHQHPGLTSATAAGEATSRLAGVDRLRAVALVAMLVHHILEWTAGDARELLPGWSGFAVTDTAAPAFAVAAGASAHLLLAARRRHSMPAKLLAGTVARRYGILVPVGMALGLAAFGDWRVIGVLGALGVAGVAACALGALLPSASLAVVAVGLLASGQAVEDWANSHGAGSAVRALLGGTFPLATYLGFVLVGWCSAGLLRRADRPGPAAAFGASLAVAAATMTAAGFEPDRYPAGLRFVIPGLAFTFLAYSGLSIIPERLPGAAGAIDRALRRAATHSLGIFVGHYLLYVVIDRAGLLRTWPVAAGWAAALAVTTAFVALAPAVARRRQAILRNVAIFWRRGYGHAATP